MKSNKTIWSLEGIYRYVPFVILALSLINIFRIVPYIFGDFTTGKLLSLFLSFFGLFIFWAAHRKFGIAKYLICLWAFPQCVIFVNLPQFVYDLSQGFSYPMMLMSSKSVSNGVLDWQTAFGINLLGVVLFAIAMAVPEKPDTEELE